MHRRIAIVAVATLQPGGVAAGHLAVGPAVVVRVRAGAARLPGADSGRAHVAGRAVAAVVARARDGQVGAAAGGVAGVGGAVVALVAQGGPRRRADAAHAPVPHRAWVAVAAETALRREHTAGRRVAAVVGAGVVVVAGDQLAGNAARARTLVEDRAGVVIVAGRADHHGVMNTRRVDSVVERARISVVARGTDELGFRRRLAAGAAWPRLVFRRGRRRQRGDGCEQRCERAGAAQPPPGAR